MGNAVIYTYITNNQYFIVYEQWRFLSAFTKLID